MGLHYPMPQQERIIGGSTTTIQTYPFACSLQVAHGAGWRHNCGCTIMNNRAVMSAAHCWPRTAAARNYRIRVGSTTNSRGGSHIIVQQLFGHAQYNTRTHDNDIGVIRTNAIPIGSATVRAGNIAGANHNPPDNANVIAIGWGFTTPTGSPSETLRHVQIRVVNLTQCRNAYGGNITANMLCAMWPGGGRGSCFGDSGTGLIHNNVVVGVTSFGAECASARWPGVYARVSRYTAWLRQHA
ncbi:trypsin CFT-1-like isoform X1 [Bicyclus anynana]|uniref:Trypsin CFT-1-like isoform X1 n=1 Tax=Bicyclus anynana TaxID=110368 RepID=A0ABM3M0Z9_BICAN|nr:trypsin CFT-1-like isoform X1 [Bicyclus anynana]